MEDIHLCDYVEVPRYGYTGRVNGISILFEETGESEAWAAGQQDPVTQEDRAGHWIHILVHGGGAVTLPVRMVKRIEPFPLVNPYRDVFFR